MCPCPDKRYGVVLVVQDIDQQPIGADVTFVTPAVISAQGVVFMLWFKWLVSYEFFHNHFYFLGVEIPFFLHFSNSFLNLLV